MIFSAVGFIRKQQIALAGRARLHNQVRISIGLWNQVEANRVTGSEFRLVVAAEDFAISIQLNPITYLGTTADCNAIFEFTRGGWRRNRRGK